VTDVYVKVMQHGRQLLVAACDAEILGKRLQEGEIIFEVRERFYKGSLMRIEEAMMLIRDATIVNLIGSNIVKNAVKAGLVHPEAILLISGVPHAQIVKL